MAEGKFDIYVYADWKGLGGPVQIGVLSAHFAKAKKAFSLTLKDTVSFLPSFTK